MRHAAIARADATPPAASHHAARRIHHTPTQKCRVQEECAQSGYSVTAYHALFTPCSPPQRSAGDIEDASAAASQKRVLSAAMRAVIAARSVVRGADVAQQRFSPQHFVLFMPRGAST